MKNNFAKASHGSLKGFDHV